MASYDELYEQVKNDPATLQQRVASVVRVSGEDVLASMMHQSATFMEWAYLQVKAEIDAKKAKLYLEDTILPLCRAKAEAHLKEEGTRATVDKTNDLAKNEEDYTIAQNHYLVALERSLVLKRVVDALFQKKDMLQSLNSRQRVELDALPHDRPPPSTWSPGLRDDSADGPTSESHDDGHLLSEAELSSFKHPLMSEEELGERIQEGRAAFRMKRKERLKQKAMENSDG